MSVAEISEQLNLTSIKDHGWHIQVQNKKADIQCIEQLFVSQFLSLKRVTIKRQSIFRRKLTCLYYYMRNYCNLFGLEQWYFSLI